MSGSARPIGVFDSGAGGLSVLRELVRLMPEEDFLFYGDSANAPYGTKTSAEVRALSGSCAKFLLDAGAKEIVIACNTATSVAAGWLRGQYPDLPIIGIEPALKPAAMQHPGGKILVLATPLTLAEEKFAHMVREYSGLAHTIPVASPRLVEFVEQGTLSGEEVEQYLRELLRPIGSARIDGAVLGCTHFPLLLEPIRRVLGDVAIYDGGPGTARQAKALLAAKGLSRPGGHKGTVRFYSSEPGKEAFYERLFAYAMQGTANN